MRGKKTSDELGNILRAGRGHRSIVDWSKDLSINKNTVGAYEHQRSLPDIEFIARFSEKTGYDFLWLLLLRLQASEDAAAKRMGESLVTLVASERDPDLESVHVPTLDLASLANGPFSHAPSDFVQAAKLSRAWLRSVGVSDPSQAALITVRDDAMAPTLTQGGLALLDRGVSRVSEGIFVLDLEGSVLCKRVQVVPGGIKLLSDNPAYEPITLPKRGAGKLKVLGRVMRIWRESAP